MRHPEHLGSAQGGGNWQGELHAQGHAQAMGWMRTQLSVWPTLQGSRAETRDESGAPFSGRKKHAGKESLSSQRELFFRKDVRAHKAAQEPNSHLQHRPR